MSRRPTSSKGSRTSGRTVQRSASQSSRGTTGVLVFFLVVFLILLVFLLHASFTPGQLILLGLLAAGLLLLPCVSWLIRRKPTSLAAPRARSARVQTSTRAEPYAVTIDDLLRLTPGEFEDFVGDLLTVTGQYRDVRRVGGTGDRGADLLARDRFGRPFIVQCKRYQPGRKVNAGEMRNFLGAKGIYRADECLFVTTSTFTEAARANMAHMQHTVFLWDGAKLTQLIEEYWSALPAHWQRFFMEQRINIID